MKKLFTKINESSGFSLIEMLVAMALLAIVMMISINIITIVGKTARTVDFQINVTQESNFAAERMRRVIRSADSISLNGSYSVTVTIQGTSINFVFEDIDGNPDTEEYVLKENGQSVMSSSVYVKPFGVHNFFDQIIEGSDLVGVKIVFQAFDVGDSNEIAGTIVSTQSINRSLILNR